MFWSLFLDNESFFTQLIEAAMLDPSYTSSELRTIKLGRYKTTQSNTTHGCHYLKIRLSLQDVIFIADNKMYCHTRGKLGGNCQVRSHLLQPLPMRLGDCASLYEHATVMDNIELRLETLHMAAMDLAWTLNEPEANPYYTKATLEAKLENLPAAATMTLPKAKKARTKERLLECLKAYRQIEALQWTEISAMTQLTHATVLESCDWARRQTGQDQFPVGTANNDFATRHIISYIDALFDKAVQEKKPGFEESTVEDRAKYRRLILHLDAEATRNGNKGLLMRTANEATLLAQLDGTHSVDGAGIDLRRWHFSYAPDHGRKALNKMIIKILQHTANPDLRQHWDWAEVEKKLIEATGTANLVDYCSGARLDCITMAAETFAGMPDIIQLLVALADRSHLGTKLQAAAVQHQDQDPEQQAEVEVKPDGETSSTYEDTRPCMNHKIEIAMMHMVELVLHRIIRIVSRQHASKSSQMTPTNNLYCMGAQWAAFLNTELRRHGLSTAYTSDFQFEVLMQIKQYVAKHG
eukprot:SAG31_NODE_7655_length_1626_cov_2.231827_1_plen_523_part_01